MTKNWGKRLLMLYRIVLSVVTVIAGVCLMVACVQIYRSGDQPYSREAVAAAFAPIRIPVYLCLAMVVGGGVLQLVMPAEEAKRKATPDVAARLERLYARTDVARWEESARQQVAREQRLRRVHRTVTAVLTLAAAAVFLVYAVDPRHFSSADVTGSVIRAMYWLLPCVLVAGGYGIFARFSVLASLRREMAVLTTQLVAGVVRKAPESPAGQSVEAVKDEADADGEAPVVPAKKPVFSAEAAVRYGVLAAGLALLVYGFATGGIADVLTKAVNICTECIGLG